MKQIQQRDQFSGPIRLAEEITARYRRYLKTTFHFRDGELRRSFADALEQEGSLVNGPYIEASPLYKRGIDCGTLVRELLDEGVEAQLVESLNPTRRLYTHQEQAIRTAHAGRNVVVATGTGSGKTEAYLYPILLDLYEEHRRGQRVPGVRALVLYPMNALAEDQRQRLGRLARTLNERGSTFAFTFGRYTGETPEDEGDYRRQAPLHIERRLPSELVLRSEIRAGPPDILLTNYSMLEYLLLRPDDSPLFDDGRGATWRFIVLDEAHQYRGSKGLEMGMLLRRLKERLRRGGLGDRVRAIATSASLGGAGDRPALARFAGDLFDEPFETEGISIGEAASAPSPGERSLASRTYVEIYRAIDSGAGAVRRLIEQAAVEIGIEPDNGIDDRGILHRLLSHDRRFERFRRGLEKVENGPIDPSKLADEVFSDDPEPAHRRRALESLTALAVWARDPESAANSLERAPLLNLRYHVFLRALEGAFVRLHPDKRVVLSRGTSSPAAEKSATFEVALCRECGQHYLVGRRADGKLVEAVRDPGSTDRGVEFFRPVEDAAAESEQDTLKLSRLCVRCGAISRSCKGKDPVEPDCGHAATILVAEEPVRERHEDQARTCGACGYRGPDPVREVIHGTDGPSAVIATALIANLPEQRRKVLAFADGRQEAAFFPCYLEDTYQNVRDRSLLLAVTRALAAKGDAKEFSLTTLSQEVAVALRERSIAGESEDDLDVGRRAWTILFRELLTDERRLSLEGVGLGSWAPRLPSRLAIPVRLHEPPWSLNAEESRHLVEWLLDSLRVDAAMELTAGEQITVGWDALGFLKTQTRAGIGEPAGRKDFKSWDGKDNRRTLFLLRSLGPGLPREEARQAVRTVLLEVWESFKDCPDLLVRAGDDGFRASPRWWRFRTLDPVDRLFRCDTCGGVQSLSIRGVCGRYRCPGSLREGTAGVEELISNHYRVLYEDQRLPSLLRAEEHTAQLEVEKAREFQRDFTEGKIHVLSSSTTFELGVDLGDLDAIFLRNVPPEPFNYAQRVGRAGRRAGHPGFAVTYCRRRPHDLVHFQAPERMMAGRSSPPKLRWTNDKIALRHVAAVLLSEFLRGHRNRFESVEALCGGLEDPQVVREVERFAREKRRQLEESLLAIVPVDLQNKLGIVDGTWIDRVTSTESRLALAVAEVSEDYRSVKRFEDEAVAKRIGRDIDWAKARAETIAKDDVISFLSRKVVIPKYGFPVDVVELELHRLRRGASREALDVTLERDLVIAVGEFAPESTVVANKTLWTSYGLKRVAGKEWPLRQYSVCKVHGIFRSWDRTETPGNPCCDHASPGEYVDPIFGFVTDRTKKPDAAKFRPERQFTTRPYFVRTEREDEPIELGGVARVWRASPGRLVTLCVGRKGQGFYVCEKCGASGTKPLAKHKTPLGAPCGGNNIHAALGHEILTDVVRVQFTVPVTAHGAEDSGVGFILSLAYALQHGAAEVLEVPPTDLNVAVRHGMSGVGLPEIVLYDNVPGGAGLVAEIETPEAFRKSLDLAHRRVADCDGCAPDTSCYGCLRSYSNQFAHPLLRRGPAADFLGALVERWQGGAGAAPTYQEHLA